MQKVIFALCFCVFFCFQTALAGENEMPVRFAFIQCGAQEDLELSCQKDSRCCRLRDMYESSKIQDHDNVGLQHETGFETLNRQYAMLKNFE